MKIKNCPWCGWSGPYTITVQKVASNKFRMRCEHCGLVGKPSRYLFWTKWKWNHMKNPVPPTTSERRYHIYGREF